MQLEALGSKSGVTRKASEPVLDGDGRWFMVHHHFFFSSKVGAHLQSQHCGRLR